MKRKNSFFLIGMTSVLLAFAMIGCDNGTSNGGSNTPTYPYTPTQPGPVVTVDKEAELYKALGNGTPVTVNVTSEIDLTTDLPLAAGQHIIVGGSGSGINVSAGRVGDGPLFAVKGTSGTLNIKAKLTLEANSSLTVAGAAAVNVITPTEGKAGTLYVKKDASVGVGVDVSGGTTLTTGASSLNVEASASLIFEKEATLAVTNNPAVSKVRLETETSAITLETGAKLAIAGTGTDATKVIGNSGNVVIEIPATAPAAIGTVTVTVEGTDTGDAIKTAVTEKIAEAVKASPSKTTDKATTAGENKGVQDLLDEDGVTRVTYSGSTALTGITVGNGQTLVISGAVTEQAAAIGGDGTLEITGSVTTADSGVDAEALASLVKATGTGKVVLKSDVDVTSELKVNLTLEIAAGKTLALGANGNINFLDEDGNITGTIVNKGTISTEQDIEDGAELGEFLALVGGTVEVSDAVISVASGDTLVIPTGTTLSLTSEASITGAAGAIIVVQGSGKITGAGNFYFSDGVTSIIPPITEGTYNWVSTIGGSGGWKAEAGTAPPTSKIATTPDEVTEFLADSYVTQVTYTGSDPLAEINQPTKKLVISGAITGQSAAISVGTLEVTGSITTSGAITVATALTNGTGTIDLDTTGTITGVSTITNNGTIKTANASGFAALVGITNSGSGKVLLEAGVSGVDTTLSLGTNLEIGTGGSIAFADSLTSAAFNGSGSLTLSGSGAISLGSGVTSLGKTVTFAAGAEGTITTATTSVGTLNTLLQTAKKLTASGTISSVNTSGVTLTVPQDTALTLSNTLTVTTSGVLTIALSGTGNGTISGTIATDGSGIINLGSNTSAGGATISNGAATGTIQTANETMLASLLGSVEVGTIEVTDTIGLGTGLTPTLGASVTLKIADDKVLTIPNSTTLKVSGTIDADGSDTGSITSTDGLIEAADATVLTAVLGEAGVTGKVSIKGTIDAAAITSATLLAGQVLYIPSPLTLTVSGAVSGAGGINNESTIALSTASGTISGVATITNTGTIKTVTDTTDTELAAFLPKVTGGTVEIVSITLAASTVVTVPSGVTLQLGNGTAAATLTLTNDTSKLVLQAGGILNAANAGSTISTTGTVGVTVEGTGDNIANTTPTTTDTGTPWTIAAGSTGPAANKDVFIGKLKLAITATTGAITVTQDSSGAIGSLQAGTDTKITFAGAASVG